MKNELKNALEANHLLQVAREVYQTNPLDKVRTNINAMCRSAIMVQMRSKGETHCAIAEFLNTDHSCVCYHFKKHEDRMKFDKNYRFLYQKFALLIVKPITKEENILNEVRLQVKKINNNLRSIGYDFAQTQTFWNEILKININ
jgi:hypothetical protein